MATRNATLPTWDDILDSFIDSHHALHGDVAAALEELTVAWREYYRDICGGEPDETPAYITDALELFEGRR